MPRCAAVKKDGKKCTCKTSQGSLYCFRHTESRIDVDTEVVAVEPEPTPETEETYADVDSLFDFMLELESGRAPLAPRDEPEIEIVKVTPANPEVIIANLLDKIKMLDARIHVLEGELVAAKSNAKTKRSPANKWAKLIYYHEVKDTPLIQAHFGESKVPWNKIKKETNRMFEMLSDEEKECYKIKGIAKYSDEPK